MIRPDGLIIAILLLAACFIGVKLLYLFRTMAMRNLAHKLGLQFRQGEQHLLFLPKGHHPLPTSLGVRGSPWTSITRAWNFIEGEKNGVRVLIFDATLGSGRGRYSTFIAANSDKNPFGYVGPELKIAHSNGWVALYCLRFWQVPWTLSVQSIEEYIENTTS
jgi:hypothetical protein